MKQLIEHLKKHPAMSAIIALIGFIAFYLLLRGKSSSAQTPAGNLAALTLQEQQLQAGVGLQNAQLQAQVQANQGAQQLQQNYIDAGVTTQNEQTDAALIAALAQNQTNAKTAQLSADVLNNQNSLEADVSNNQTNAELQVALGQIGAQTNLVNQQATLYGQEVTAAQVLATQQQNNSFQLSSAALANLGKVGGSQNRVAIIGAALNQPQTAVAAEYGQTASSISGDSLLASVANTIANFGKTVVNSL
jgi:hypothetical protein